MLWRVCLSALVIFPTCVSANPLSKFLMMNSDGQQAHMQGGGGNAGNGAQQQQQHQQQQQCVVDPEQYSQLQTQVDELKHQLQQEQANSKRLNEIKEDLVKEMAKISSSASKELTTARHNLKEAQDALLKEQAIVLELQTKLADTIQVKDDLANQRVRETENLYKMELELQNATYMLQLEQAQSEAEHKCSLAKLQMAEEIHHARISSSDGNGSSTTAAAAATSSVEKVKFQVLQEENAALLKQQQTLQQLVDGLESKFTAKFHEKEVQLKDHFADNLEEKAAALCQEKLQHQQSTSERQLTKAMDMCQEETAQQVQAAKDEAKLVLNTQHGKCISEIVAAKRQHLVELRHAVANHTKAVAQLQLSHNETLQKANAEQMALRDNLTMLEQQKKALADQLQQETTRFQQSEAEAVAACQTSTADLQKTLDQCRDDHDGKAKELQVYADKLEASNQTVQELQKKLIKAEERTAQVKGGLSNDLQAANKATRQCQKDLTTNQGQSQYYQTELTKCQKDVQYWMNVHEQRAFFNWTHGEEEAVAFALQVRLATVTRTLELYHAADQATRPYTQPMKQWYQRHLQKHVDPVLARVHTEYQKHVAPQVNQWHRQMQQQHKQWNEAAQTWLQALFQHVVFDIQHVYCPQWKKLVPHTAPALVGINLKQLCYNEDTTAVYLARSFYVTAFVLAVLLRRSLWRLLVVTWMFFWKMVRGLVVITAKSLWFLCPLRWVIPSSPAPKKGSSSSSNISSNETGKKNKKPKPADTKHKSNSTKTEKNNDQPAKTPTNGTESQ